MSDQADTAFAAAEAKMAEIQQAIQEGGGSIRVTETAPEQGTPVPEPQPRDEKGRFATETVTEVAPVETQTAPKTAPQTAPEPTQEAQDPAIAALLQKYGGDTNKALQAFVHAQRKLGEQSNEIGESRKIIDELVALRETVAQGQQQTPQIDQPTVDWFDQQVLENPAQALNWAAQTGNQMLINRGVSIWKDNDPFGAAMYAANLQRQQDRAEFERQLAEIRQVPANERVAQAVNSVLSEHSEFAQYADGLEHTMDRYPTAGEAFRLAVESGDVKKIEGAVETLFGLAERDTLRSLVLTGSTPAETTTTTQVVEQTETPEAHGEDTPEPTPQDRFRAAFAEEAARQRGERVIPKNAYVAS